MKLIFVWVLCVLRGQCMKSCEINENGELITTSYHYGKANFSIIDCSRRKLQEIPAFPEELNVTELYLDHNNIGSVYSKNFMNVSKHLEILDLSYNGIYYLPDHKVFSYLHQLKILKLGHNGYDGLCLLDPVLQKEGIFQGLNELHTLYLLGTCKSYYEYPDKIFKDLISLEKLYLDVALNFIFKSGFRDLRRLKYLEVTSYDCFLEYRHISEINVLVITNETFVSFEDSPITSLVLRGCAFKAIHPGSLAMLKNLTNLNLACATDLNFPEVVSAIQKMPSDTLETLILDGMKMQNGTSFCHKNFNNVKRMSIRGTGISNIKMANGNQKQCLESLEYLNIAANSPPMTFNYYFTSSTFRFSMWSDIFWSTKPIPIVDASNMLTLPYYVTNVYCKFAEQPFDDYFQTAHTMYVNPPFPKPSYTDDTYLKRITSIDRKHYFTIFGATVFHFSPSPSINVVYASDNFATGFWDMGIFKHCPLVFFPTDEVVYLNLSNNNIQIIPCPFVGMMNLKVFDCTGCRLHHIHPDFFTQKHLPNLEFLHLGQNNLGRISPLFTSFFPDSKKLKEIILARNNIQTLPENSFENTEAFPPGIFETVVR